MRLDIPAGDFAGYIFDLDGTLLDTMPLHFEAWEQALQAVGLTRPLEEDFFIRSAARPRAGWRNSLPGATG